MDLSKMGLESSYNCRHEPDQTGCREEDVGFGALMHMDEHVRAGNTFPTGSLSRSNREIQQVTLKDSILSLTDWQ